MDVRRSARVATEFRVAIQGVEEEPVLRQGNLSTTGVYFVTDADVGEVGMISWLVLLSTDGAKRAHVMAYVVRRVSVLGFDGKPVAGVAFEFMPESEASAVAVQEFVRYVLSLHRDGDAPRVSSQLDVTAAAGTTTTPSSEPGSAQAATMRELSVRSVVLETTWSVGLGEPVTIDVGAPGMARRMRLGGRAVKISTRSTPEEEKPRFLIELEVSAQTERPMQTVPPPSLPAGIEAKSSQDPVPLALKGMDDEEVSRTLDELLSALIVPPAPPDKPRRRRHLSTHLSGLLARVPVTTLFSLFEMERMTGKLVVRTPNDHVTIWASEGQLLDVEPLGDAKSRRDRLTSVLGWKDGAFEFYVEPVDRPNEFGTTTTALLLDLMRAADEAAHGGDAPPTTPTGDRDSII